MHPEISNEIRKTLIGIFTITGTDIKYADYAGIIQEMEWLLKKVKQIQNNNGL